MGVRIRKADPAERETLSEFARAAKRHWGYPAAWMALWEDELAFAPDGFDEWQVWCASVGGEVVGVASLGRDGDEAELENLWVLPDFIGRGVGKALFRHAVRLAAPGRRRQSGGGLKIALRQRRISTDWNRPAWVAAGERLRRRPVGHVDHEEAAGDPLAVVAQGGAAGDDLIAEAFQILHMGRPGLGPDRCPVRLVGGEYDEVHGMPSPVMRLFGRRS